MSERGSSKLGTLTPEDLHMAIDVARSSYTVERWWKYGQPAIDRIAAVLNVKDPAQAGSVIGGFIKLQGTRVQVGLEVFPYGITAPDGVRIAVTLDQAVGQ